MSAPFDPADEHDTDPNAGAVVDMVAEFDKAPVTARISGFESSAAQLDRQVESAEQAERRRIQTKALGAMLDAMLAEGVPPTMAHRCLARAIERLRLGGVAP